MVGSIFATVFVGALVLLFGGMVLNVLSSMAESMSLARRGYKTDKAPRKSAPEGAREGQRTKPTHKYSEEPVARASAAHTGASKRRQEQGTVETYTTARTQKSSKEASRPGQSPSQQPKSPRRYPEPAAATPVSRPQSESPSVTEAAPVRPPVTDRPKTEPAPTSRVAPAGQAHAESNAPAYELTDQEEFAIDCLKDLAFELEDDMPLLTKATQITLACSSGATVKMIGVLKNVADANRGGVTATLHDDTGHVRLHFPASIVEVPDDGENVLLQGRLSKSGQANVIWVTVQEWTDPYVALDEARGLEPQPVVLAQAIA